MQIRSLPTEIFVLILLQLGTEELLQCTKVCRAFREAAQSCEVQYKLELAYAGMEDGDAVATPVADRLNALREYQEGWYTAALRHQLISEQAAAVVGSRDVPVRCIPFVGSVVPFYIGSKLRLLRPSSPIRRIAERRWTIPLERVDIQPDFCTVDLSQDLVVVTGHRVGSPLTSYCYLLSLTPTEKPPVHPLSIVPFIPVLGGCRRWNHHPCQRSWGPPRMVDRGDVYTAWEGTHTACLQLEEGHPTVCAGPDGFQSHILLLGRFCVCRRLRR
ncbi:hypothetical protein OH77DRAFT_1254773 [Trametes cingulata]|nr:hypothetical protein OH77DRAFT_1254773 [Trametes cingulata]